MCPLGLNAYLRLNLRDGWIWILRAKNSTVLGLTKELINAQKFLRIKNILGLEIQKLPQKIKNE